MSDSSDSTNTPSPTPDCSGSDKNSAACHKTNPQTYLTIGAAIGVPCGVALILLIVLHCRHTWKLRQEKKALKSLDVDMDMDDYHDYSPAPFVEPNNHPYSISAPGSAVSVNRSGLDPEQPTNGQYQHVGSEHHVPEDPYYSRNVPYMNPAQHEYTRSNHSFAGTENTSSYPAQAIQSHVQGAHAAEYRDLTPEPVAEPEVVFAHYTSDPPGQPFDPDGDLGTSYAENPGRSPFDFEPANRDEHPPAHWAPHVPVSNHGTDYTRDRALPARPESPYADVMGQSNSLYSQDETTPTTSSSANDYEHPIGRHSTQVRKDSERLRSVYREYLPEGSEFEESGYANGDYTSGDYAPEQNEQEYYNVVPEDTHLRQLPPVVEPQPYEGQYVYDNAAHGYPQAAHDPYQHPDGSHYEYPEDGYENVNYDNQYGAPAHMNNRTQSPKVPSKPMAPLPKLSSLPTPHRLQENDNPVLFAQKKRFDGSRNQTPGTGGTPAFNPLDFAVESKHLPSPHAMEQGEVSGSELAFAPPKKFGNRDRSESGSRPMSPYNDRPDSPTGYSMDGRRTPLARARPDSGLVPDKESGASKLKPQMNLWTPA